MTPFLFVVLVVVLIIGLLFVEALVTLRAAR